MVAPSPHAEPPRVPPPTREELEELGAKYAEIIRLRHAQTTGANLDPRPALARLAARFPGALRELDELPMEELAARLAALDRAAREAEAHEAWMTPMARYHVAARGALAVKRWLRGARRVEPTHRAAFTLALRDGTLTDEAAAWEQELEALASPPRGRLTDVVLARIGRELGVALDEVRALVRGATRHAQAD